MELTQLLSDIRACTHCSEHLPMGSRPCLAAHTNSKIMIVGQAPGTKVHESGIPWDDQSGKLLREWLGVTNEQFYNPELFAIVPMGFCYPGKKANGQGDARPRAECAPMWHDKLLNHMPNLQLTLLIGEYAQKYYLKDKMKNGVTASVRNYEDYLPKYLPLPHPSPRNRSWFKKNPWFNTDVVPVLKSIVKNL